MKIAWVTSGKDRCGIATYAAELFPVVQEVLRATGGGVSGAEARLFALSAEEASQAHLLTKLREFRPELIHIQHEYGLWGGKNWPLYQFPAFVKRLRREFSGAKLVATAHSVLPRDYRFPMRGGMIERCVRRVLNWFCLPVLRYFWSKKTWGVLDAVVVHSRLQVAAVRASGCSRVEVMPHFVFQRKNEWRGVQELSAQPPVVLVFGFMTPDKGQDIAIDAFARLHSNAKLLIAGDPRCDSDVLYAQKCKQAVESYGLLERVVFTGFVAEDRVDEVFQQATLVLAPFRSTTGSGSLAQAMARGMPVLCSDLALNRELNERTPGALAFFRSEDADDCARELENLLNNPAALQALHEGSLRYAELHSVKQIAPRQAELYQKWSG